MLRKLLIGLVAAGATVGVLNSPNEADARPRVRVYVGPNLTSVRLRGGSYRNYHPYRRYDRPYNSGVTFSYGQPYYGHPYHTGTFGYPYYNYGYSQPQPGVYYHY